MEPELLAKELRSAGLVVLAVAHHPVVEDVFVVYLHGNAGQWVDEHALTTAAELRNVVSVEESIQTPTILLVKVRPG